MVYFITGLPGTGKTTAAVKLCDILQKTTAKDPIHLDGDVMRQCWSRIGYEESDRLENIRRIKMTAKLFHDYGLDIVVSVVAPSAISRKEFREEFGSDYREVLLTEIHEKRPDHYYPNYEFSEDDPEFVGNNGLESLINLCYIKHQYL